jgi:hypothetical protein
LGKSFEGFLIQKENINMQKQIRIVEIKIFFGYYKRYPVKLQMEIIIKMIIQFFVVRN